MVVRIFLKYLDEFTIERPLMMLAEFSGHPELRELAFRMRHRFESMSDKSEITKSEKL